MTFSVQSRWIAVAGLATAVLFYTNGLWAQNNSARGAGAGKVACVDVVKALNEYQRQKDLDEEFNQKGQALNTENMKRRNEIDSFQKTVDSLTDADPTYMEKQRQLLSMQIAYKNWFDATQADMARETGVWRMRLYRDLLDAVKAVAAKQGYDLVLYKDDFEPKSFEPDAIANQIRGRKVLYAANTADITQSVTDQMNEQYRSQPKKPMVMVTAPTPEAAPAQPAAKKP